MIQPRLTKIWNSNETCVICGAKKIRYTKRNGYLEDIANFVKRKTCGHNTDCFRKYISGKGNPNYKGYMPKCIICNKRIGYNLAKEMKAGLFSKYCREHARDSYKSGELHDSISLRNKIRGLEKRGIYPEQLKRTGINKKMGK